MNATVLTIAGSDPSGGAGIQNDLKTIAAHGLHGTSCITVVTVQNTEGVAGKPLFLDPGMVRSQIDAVLRDLPPSSLKIGLLGNTGISRAVAEEIKGLGIPTVLDPVTRCGSGDQLLEADPWEVLRPVMGLATVVTPNVPEAETLAGSQIRTLDDAEEAARRILGMGAGAVVVKGGHLKGEPFTDVFVRDGYSKRIPGVAVESRDNHGAGCTFSTAIACNLALGMDLEDSVVSAKEFTRAAIENGFSLGRGRRPVNPTGGIVREAESLRIAEEISGVVARVEANPGFGILVPQVGTNIAVAPMGAKDPGEVIGLSGRIVRVAGLPRAGGCPVRGGSSHMARMALALRDRTGRLRCCMNIRYSTEILEAARAAGLSLSRFDRETEPKGRDTMEWGLTEALGRGGEVPDLIFDEGAPGKEAMIRVLGSSAEEALGKAMKILAAIR